MDIQLNAYTIYLEHLHVAGMMEDIHQYAKKHKTPEELDDLVHGVVREGMGQEDSINIYKTWADTYDEVGKSEVVRLLLP